eukprot:2621335-Pyramimonas_sp.AAC.2
MDSTGCNADAKGCGVDDTQGAATGRAARAPCGGAAAASVPGPLRSLWNAGVGTYPPGRGGGGPEVAGGAGGGGAAPTQRGQARRARGPCAWPAVHGALPLLF